MMIMTMTTTKRSVLPRVAQKTHFALIYNQHNRYVYTSLTAHIRAMDPILLVIVTSVDLAKSALLTL